MELVEGPLVAASYARGSTPSGQTGSGVGESRSIAMRKEVRVSRNPRLSSSARSASLGRPATGEQAPNRARARDPPPSRESPASGVRRGRSIRAHRRSPSTKTYEPSADLASLLELHLGKRPFRRALAPRRRGSGACSTHELGDCRSVLVPRQDADRSVMPRRASRARPRVGDAGQRRGRPRVLRLVAPVDPDRRDPELLRRLDVMEQALRDVDVATSIGARGSRRPPSACARACTTRSRRRRSPGRTARRSRPSKRRSGRGRCSRGSRASSHGRAPPSDRAARLRTPASRGASARARSPRPRGA